MTSDTPLQQLLRALVRFWWVALLGIVLAGLAFTFATYKVKLGLPPKLTARTQPTYSASTQMLVTSKRDPNLSSTNVNAKKIQLGQTTPGIDGAAPDQHADTRPTTAAAAPTATCSGSTRSRTTCPRASTSDPVIKLAQPEVRAHQRQRERGQPVRLLGRGRLPLRPAAVHPDQRHGRARPTTRSPSRTRRRWRSSSGSRRKQVANNIPTGNRVVVEQVNSADHATASGGSKPLLGIAAALFVLLGAAGFALALDRLIPRRSRSGAHASPCRPAAAQPRRSARSRPPSPSCPRSRCRR